MQDHGNWREHRLACDSWPKTCAPVIPASGPPLQTPHVSMEGRPITPFPVSHSCSHYSAKLTEDISASSVAARCAPTPLRVHRNDCSSLSYNSQMRTTHSSFFDLGHGNLVSSAPSNALAPPPESDASLQELLAPLVAECLHDRKRIAPPNALELDGAFAAISAIGDLCGSNGGSYFASALRSLAQHGFRRCSLVVDKLGLSIRCLEELSLGCEAEQVDFSWSSISDVQDPHQKAGLQGCAVTVGIREPVRLFEGPCGGLALVLRVRNRESARRLADAALAFKAYEAQTTLWNCVGNKGQASLIGLTKLLLDDHGCAVWSLPDNQSSSVSQVPKVFAEPCVYMEQGSTSQTPCCNLCWC